MTRIDFISRFEFNSLLMMNWINIQSNGLPGLSGIYLTFNGRTWVKSKYNSETKKFKRKNVTHWMRVLNP